MIDLHSRPKPTPTIVCPWYTVTDLAALFAVDPRTVLKWVAAGRLPEPVRKGRKWTRWPKPQIDALIAAWAQEGGASA